MSICGKRRDRRCCNNNTMWFTGPFIRECFCERFIDVPMKVHRGEGFGLNDCCEQIVDELRGIQKELRSDDRGRCKRNCR